MKKPRIYVDTTIPSAYHTTRTDPAMLKRRDETRRWWEIALSTCELVTSRAVLRELLADARTRFRVAERL
jgi:hypothetical protein